MGLGLLPPHSQLTSSVSLVNKCVNLTLVLRGSADVSRRDDETNAHVPDPTHVITQPEDETKNPVDVERNEDGGKDLVLGPTHITEPVSDHHENLPLTDSLGIDINAGNGVETNQASVPDPAPITQPENESRRRKKRAPDWEPHETEKLIESKLQNLNWDQISDLIPGRPSKGCRQRWETIGRPYKKVKKLCNDRGEDVSQVTEEDLRSMKMGTIYVRNRHWFKMVDDYYSFKSGKSPSMPLAVLLFCLSARKFARNSCSSNPNHGL